MRFEVIDQCPVPAKLAPALRRIKARSGATLNSCDRSPEAEPILRRHGKKSQRQLYEGFIKGLPGYNPANPPGKSTHERRCDRIAYPLPVGARLPYWCVGMDWSHPGAVISAARTEGFLAKVTYPSNPREGHHINFSKEPRLKLRRALKRGSKGRAVVALTRRLSFVHSREDGKPYLDGKRGVFDVETEAALRKFQREHQLEVDGVLGPHSQSQLMASVRWHKHHRKGGR